MLVVASGTRARSGTSLTTQGGRALRALHDVNLRYPTERHASREMRHDPGGMWRRRELVLGTLALTVVASCTSDVPDRLLSPAPKPTGPVGFCPFGLSRAPLIRPESLDSVMANHVPHWLPDGMGLVQAFGPGVGSLGGAYFADARCREIELWFWKSTGVASGERMGAWTVMVSGPNACGNAVLGSGRCIEYHAPVDGGSIGVQMMGIPRSDGDRIVRSIPI